MITILTMIWSGSIRTSLFFSVRLISSYLTDFSLLQLLKVRSRFSP